MDSTDFTQFWELFAPDTCFLNRRAATEREWNSCTQDKKQAVINWLKRHGNYKGRNPYFFLQDFREVRAEPTNYNGRSLKDGVQYVSARYNGAWGLYTIEDVKLFNMETKQ
jgi:hypothetical protein